MSDPEVLDVLRQWLRFAEEDLQTARTLLGQGGVPRTSCFHAQQAAEKAMKAIFVYSQVEYPYSPTWTACAIDSQKVGRLRRSFPTWRDSPRGPFKLVILAKR